jgi:hypothetical protein
MTVPARTRSGGTALILAIITAAGCTGDVTVVAPTADAPGPEFAAAMSEAIADEYRAEMTYEGVLSTLGQVRPFTSIIQAEVRHSQALASLFQRRGLPVPVNPWAPEDIPVYASISAACTAGVEAEIANAAIYDRYLALDLPSDARQVFQSNRDASVFNHLLAFQRCAGG